jgi:hypothetical protein
MTSGHLLHDKDGPDVATLQQGCLIPLFILLLHIIGNISSWRKEVCHFLNP